jgi:hypothetical protein
MLVIKLCRVLSARLTVLLLTTAAATAYAEDVQFASYENRLGQLEADYVSLTSQISHLPEVQSGCSAKCGCHARLDSWAGRQS